MDASSKWEARFLAEARRSTTREFLLRRRLLVFLGILMVSGLLGYMAAVFKEHWPPDASLLTPVLLGLAVLVYCISSFHYLGLVQGAIEHLRRRAEP
jgi:hypothetical protein